MNPRGPFALLIPWFNKIKYAEETIASLKALRGDEFKVLIVDDCSTDGADREVQKLILGDPTFLWRRNEKNLHIARTYRRLISWAHWLGFQIVGFMDCDDVIHPEAIERVLDFYASGPYKGMVYTQFGMCDHNLGYQGRGFAAPIPDGHSAIEGLGGNVSHFRTVRLREYFKTDGFEEETQQCSDKDLMWKMEEVCKLWFLDEELYSWRGWAEGSLTAGDATRAITAHHDYVARQRAIERRTRFQPNWIEFRDRGFDPRG